MNDDTSNESDKPSLFHFGKEKAKKKVGIINKIEEKRKHLMQQRDHTDLKRKTEDKATMLRKEAKNKKFQRRRLMKSEEFGKEEEDKFSSNKSFSVEEAESLYQEGMDIMDYFKILAKTEFEIPHFLLLIELICEKEDHKILFGIVGLRKLLSLIENPPIQSVIDANLLPILISLMGRTDFPRLQFEVLWCLTNIASGKAEHVQALIDKGAIPIFISMLASEQKNIVEQSIWALGNIAGEEAYFKNLILKEGAIHPLGLILDSAEPDTMLARNWVWCLTNLLRGKPMPDDNDIMYLIPIYWKILVQNTKKEILTDTMWGLSYISDTGEKAIIKILETGVCERLAGLLELGGNNLSNQAKQEISYTNIILPAIRALGNFVTGEDTETQTVMESGVLPHLHNLLSHPDAAIRKESCWTLSNICAGTAKQVAVVIESGAFDMLIRLVQEDIYEIQREAGWSVSNATALRNPEIIEKVVEKGGIEAMFEVLKHKVDPKTAVVLLEGIKNVLEVGKTHFFRDDENPFTTIVEDWGGLDKLEDMQGHQNQHVYELAVEILENYFPLEEVDMQNTEQTDLRLEF